MPSHHTFQFLRKSKHIFKICFLPNTLVSSWNNIPLAYYPHQTFLCKLFVDKFLSISLPSYMLAFIAEILFSLTLYFIFSNWQPFLFSFQEMSPGYAGYLYFMISLYILPLFWDIYHNYKLIIICIIPILTISVSPHKF